MKNNHWLSSLILLFAAISFSSCEVEPIDPRIVINPTPEVPEEPGTPLTGDYWPSELNNEWTFKRNGVVQSALKIISINNIGGQTYYTFNPQTAANIFGGSIATVRLRKSNSNYYLKLDDLVQAPVGQTPGFTTTGAETILLKDNVAVGGSWVTSYTQTTTYTSIYPSISSDVLVTGTVMEKDITVTVQNIIYTDVIKTKYVQKMTSAAGTTESISYYWFAKGVGPIKITTETAEGTFNSELSSYLLN